MRFDLFRPGAHFLQAQHLRRLLAGPIQQPRAQRRSQTVDVPGGDSHRRILTCKSELMCTNLACKFSQTLGAVFPSASIIGANFLDRSINMGEFFTGDYHGAPFVLFGSAHLAALAVVILINLTIIYYRNDFIIITVVNTKIGIYYKTTI